VLYALDFGHKLHSTPLQHVPMLQHLAAWRFTDTLIEWRSAVCACLLCGLALISMRYSFSLRR